MGIYYCTWRSTYGINAYDLMVECDLADGGKVIECSTHPLKYAGIVEDRPSLTEKIEREKKLPGNKGIDKHKLQYRMFKSGSVSISQMPWEKIREKIGLDKPFGLAFMNDGLEKLVITSPVIDCKKS